MNDFDATHSRNAQDTPARVRPVLSIVIPCYNEAESIPSLASSLNDLRRNLSADYQIQLVLVDDGSSDHTQAQMRQCFRDWDFMTIVSHHQNQGIAVAMMSGFRASQGDCVCTIDSDGSYDPMQLPDLLSRLTDDVDVVTASPYHPSGSVGNVPGWRLNISRAASWAYRWAFRQPLHTYTSCFRIYRRRAIERLTTIRCPGFVGVTEILWQLDQVGCVIVECPARLTARQFGVSKMRLLRVAREHLTFLASALWNKYFRSRIGSF